MPSSEPIRLQRSPTTETGLQLTGYPQPYSDQRTAAIETNEHNTRDKPKIMSESESEKVQNRLERMDDYKQKEGAYALHFVGVGSAGVGIARSLLRQQSTEELLDEGGELTIWAVDIDDTELTALEDEIDTFHNQLEGHGISSDRASIMVRHVETPDRDDLLETLRAYREHLKREYPAYYWQPNYDPWIPADVDLDVEHMRRGVSKAIYGHHYYETEVLKGDMRQFAERVEESELPPQVYIAFGIGGGTGGGIVPDLARHLSHVMLGRRTPVTGVGVLPCSGDREENRGTVPYMAINDLDSSIEEVANDGVVDVWGELYRNPFNNGFQFVSQEPAYQSTGDLEATHDIVDDSIARLITEDSGLAGWNVTRVAALLTDIDNPAESWPPRSLPTHDVNWVNLIAPIRPGDDVEGALDSITVDVVDGADTLYSEARINSADGAGTDEMEAKVDEKLSEIASQVSVSTTSLGATEHDHELEHPQETEVLGFVPGLTKVDLTAFVEGQDTYDDETDERNLVLDHSYLMELGVMLNEPSVRFEGVAGECIWGCACWVGVPMDRVRGVNLTQGEGVVTEHEAEHEHAHSHD